MGIPWFHNLISGGILSHDVVRCGSERPKDQASGVAPNAPGDDNGETAVFLVRFFSKSIEIHDILRGKKNKTSGCWKTQYLS